jgi:Lactonase, 7-bladed beta-propeller
MDARSIGALTLAAVVLSGCGGNHSGSSAGKGAGGTQTYAVGGTLSGVDYGAGSGSSPQLILYLNGGDALQHPSNGPFSFSQKLAAGAAYTVTARVSLLNPVQTCTLTNATGTAGPSSANSVTVTCKTTTYTLGGTVSGLTGSGLVISDGSENLPIAADGAFQFTRALPSGMSYTLAVTTQPSNPGQICSLTSSGNGLGQVTDANITGITIVCNDSSYTLGGTVSGLTGTGLVVSVTATNGLSISAAPPITASVPVAANGSFTVPNFVMATGFIYSASASSMPTGQTCLVPDGTGTVGRASVTVTVVCAAPRFAYAAGGHDNDVLGYAVSFTDGSLSALPGSPYAAGDTTTAVALDPTGHFLFAANQGATGGAYSNTISVYSIDQSTGALTPLAGSPFAATMAPIALAVAPSGKFLYVADYHDNTVTAFAISSTGALTPVTGSPVVAGIDGPRALTILPNGKVLYLAASNDRAVYSYTVDTTTGALTAVMGSPLAAPGGPGQVELLLSATFSPTDAFAMWADTAPVYLGQGPGGDTLSAYELDPNTGAFGESFSFGTGQGVLPLPDFGVADPEGRLFHLVGRQSHAGSDEVQTLCWDPSCSGQGQWQNPYDSGVQATWAAVEPSGRFLFLTDSAGNAVPLVIDRVGAKLTAGTVTPGAFRPYNSVVFTTQ